MGAQQTEAEMPGERGDFGQVEVGPHDCADETRNRVGQEVGEAPECGVAHQVGVDDQGQEQRRQDHDRDLEDSEEHDATNTVPEGRIRAHLLEVLQTDEFLHRLAATEQPTAFGNLLVEACPDALDDGGDEHDDEDDGERQREEPTGQRLVSGLSTGHRG